MMPAGIRKEVLMSRTRRFVMAAATVTTVAVLVSPAGAATTAWTSAKLTHAVKGLTHYMTADNRRDRRQQLQLRSVGRVNFIQGQKLHSLSAFTATAGGRLSALEAQDAIQAGLNGGILDLDRCVELPVGSPGAPHGGWLFVTRSGDSYVVYNGGPGPKGDKGDTGAKGEQGDQGAPGQNGKDGSNGVDGAAGAPGLTAYEEWLAAGNSGSIADFLHSIVGPQGPKGDRGDTGAPGTEGKDGSNGTDGAPGQSAYQAWLAVGNTGTVADFVHSLIGPQGPKGDRGATGPQGPQGVPGIPNATLTTLCVKQHGGGSYYLTTSCSGVSDTFQVYVAN
jgi:hypothetical protein